MIKQQLSQYVNVNSTDAVFDEVKQIICLLSHAFNQDKLEKAYQRVIDIFEGKSFEFKACNTKYHDLKHTIETFLTMARLIHGASLTGIVFTDREIFLGLISALLHDVGYIQKKDDKHGTGAKYTEQHVARSMKFLKDYGHHYGLSSREIELGRNIIYCTDLSVEPGNIKFASDKNRLLGNLLGTADIFSQMSDRNYLEKLLFLFRELKESRSDKFNCEIDLFKKTIGFYEYITKRIETSYNSVDRFIIPHFIARWDVNIDLYKVAINKHISYLNKIINDDKLNICDMLRRYDVVRNIRILYDDSC